VAAARKDELAILEQANALLTVNAQLSTDLTNEVSRLVAQANTDIVNARSHASSLQAVNRNVLLAVAASSLVSSILIVWLYVGRNLIRRLTALSESMLEIAAGNLQAPLPAPIGGDEIAEMTHALVVFRNTAVEIEANNLREIALARQRLVEAIESISEGFALYDAEDLLVLSNRRYREVASPADPEAIVPGLRFEAVIRRVATLGAIDTAGHRNEDWIAQRMAAHWRREGSSVLYEYRGRWLQVSERPAGNGGVVVVWTDVTALKQGEILLREALDRINKELAAARQLQLSMVPRNFPAWSEGQPIEIQAVMEPAREVGGDLYDFFLAAPGKFCFVVGDVSGKGTAAALFMARTRSLVRAIVALWRQTTGAVPAPSDIMQAVNRELCLDNSERMFVTVFLATLDLATGEVAYANAGHPVPYLMSPGSPPIGIPASPDVPLGIQSGAKFHDRSMALREHEALCLVTDGVLDALNPSEEFFGKDRLTHTLAGLDGNPPSAIVSGVLKAVDDFAGGTPRFDDVTLLALRWSRSAPLRPDAGDTAAQSRAP
jgi:serine phosphatase RsbU (regulator of sigma subunit)/HAMP domain-containing protein